MRFSKFIWLIFPLFAIFEIALSEVIARSEPELEHIRAATSIVRDGYKQGDLVVITPDWYRQPRVELGSDVLPLPDQARADEKVYKRLWEVSLRGSQSPESSGLIPEFERKFGQIIVRRFLLSQSAEKVYDFIDSLDEAEIFTESGSQKIRCLKVGHRTKCHPIVPDRNVWIGIETISDLDHRPRQCIWAHPLKNRRLLIEFNNVPRGDFLEGHLATDYVLGRHCSSDPVDFSIKIRNETIASHKHYDCDSWKSFRIKLDEFPEKVDVTFVISAENPEKRHFCFQAQMRNGS